MFEREQIIFNGEFISDKPAILLTENRAFLYGDSIFDTIRVKNNNILFFDLHFLRLTAGMKVLKYKIPEDLSVFKKNLITDIKKLIHKNKLQESSRVRITIFRKKGGFYTPETNDFNYVISCTKLKNQKFKLNTYGLSIGIYKDIKKPVNAFSQFKTANSILYTLAGIFSKENKFDDCLILNEKGNIIETVSSNIFIVKNNIISTPPVSEGCIKGIMRNVIISYAKLLKITCIEKKLNKEDLLNADEVFITNSIKGIQWVVAYENKRFYKKMSDFLIKTLNENT